jgi:hypothetical protein
LHAKASAKEVPVKTAVLCGLTLLVVAPAFAQTSAPAAGDPSGKTVTLTGCVGGGADSKPITLSQALIVPGSSRPGQADPSLVPPSSSAGTETPDPTLPPPTAAPVPPVSTPTGTSGTKTPASGASTTGVVTGTAPAGSSGSSVTGYRLTGADMQPWIGKRVMLSGSFVPASPSATAPAGTSSTVTGAAATPPVLEFRVQSVQPTTGPCGKEDK